MWVRPAHGKTHHLDSLAFFLATAESQRGTIGERRIPWRRRIYHLL